MEKENTKDRIINSANSLFIKGSYNMVGVNEICKEAGVAKGSFYNFFSSKEDLLLQVLDKNTNHLIENILHPIFNDATLGFEEQISKFFDTAFSMQAFLKKSNGKVVGCPFGNMVVENATVNEGIRKKVESTFGIIKEVFVKNYMDEYKTSLQKAEGLGDMLLVCLQGAFVLAKTKNDLEIINNSKRSFLLLLNNS